MKASLLRSVVKYLANAAYLYSGYIQVRNWCYRQRRKSLVTVLAYHRVSDDPDDVNAVSTANFDRQMACLRRHYRVITIAELLDILQRGENAERAVVITFDDGYRDNFTHALPILTKHGLSACFFIASGFVGQERPFPHDLSRLRRGVPAMSWEEVAEMARQGFEIGSHTVNHVRLSECNDSTLARELSESREMLESRAGKEIRYFSFPFGKASDCSEKAVDFVKGAGYACNFSAYGGVNLPTEDPYHLKRQGVSDHPSILYFRAWVEGWKVRAY